MVGDTFRPSGRRSQEAAQLVPKCRPRILSNGRARSRQQRQVPTSRPVRGLHPLICSILDGNGPGEEAMRLLERCAMTRPASSHHQLRCALWEREETKEADKQVLGRRSMHGGHARFGRNAYSPGAIEGGSPSRTDMAGYSMCQHRDGGEGHIWRRCLLELESTRGVEREPMRRMMRRDGRESYRQWSPALPQWTAAGSEEAVIVTMETAGVSARVPAGFDPFGLNALVRAVGENEALPRPRSERLRLPDSSPWLPRCSNR